jgi:hypothetical protein
MHLVLTYRDHETIRPPSRGLRLPVALVEDPGADPGGVLVPGLVMFAGTPGVALDFVARRNSQGAAVYRTREYFAVRGNAAFVLGMGSATWEEHLPLIEQIAGRFELAE